MNEEFISAKEYHFKVCPFCGEYPAALDLPESALPAPRFCGDKRCEDDNQQTS